MSLLPRSPKIIISVHQLPENSQDPLNPWRRVCALSGENLNLVYANNKGADQTARIPACAFAQSGQHLCCLLCRKYNRLTGYMSISTFYIAEQAGLSSYYMVDGLEDRFTRAKGHMPLF